MMVIFQNDTYADKNNKIASDIVSYVAKRHRVVRIVHENTFRSMIMVSKRRYVALTAVGDQLIEKGVESVRRDYCLFARNLYREIARMILSQKQISESLANEEWLCRLCTIVKNKIMQLKDMNQVDVVSKHLRIFKMMNQQILSETKGDQRQKPYHIQAAMGKPGNVPIMTGELIPYVVLTQGRAIYGSVQSISEINWEYYIQVQFLDPLYRLLLAAQVNIDFVKGQFAEIYPVKSTAKLLVSNAILRSQEISYSGSNPADFYLTYHLMPKWKERNPNLALWKQFTCV
jgi:DNA polymerase elongation subunit (family B)